MIYTIGDSHSRIPWQQIKNVDINHLGPILAFSVGRDGLDRVNISNMKIKENDYIVFCFGEIDCRGHIHKHITKENTYQKQIDFIVENYFNTIRKNKKLINFHINICVSNVVPATPFYTETFRQVAHNSEFPFVGTDEERKTYVQYFNKKLAYHCEKNDYLFIDIYDKCVDQNGYLNWYLSDRNVHLGTSLPLRNFLKERNIL